MFSRMMVSALALTGVAYAQTPSGETPASVAAAQSGDRVVYEAAHFTQYNPQNAADMVSQTPGFTLNGGDDRRGFSGAVGNLLIDGLRPSTKSQSLEGILSRIPANQVLRIEVLRGGAVAGDASGQSTLLNVVRTPSAGSGLFSVGSEFMEGQDPAPRGEASYSGRNGQVEYGVGINLFSQNRDLPGWRRFYDAAGALTGTADTPSPRRFRENSLNGNVAFPLAGGRFSATAQADQFTFHADSDFLFYDAIGTPVPSLLTEFDEEGGGVEVGLNYDHDFGPWQMGLIGLVNRRTYESTEDVDIEDGFGALLEQQFQAVNQESGETILRGSLARAFTSRHRIEFGGEVAVNTLDQTLSFVFDDGGGPTPLLIPNSNVSVEEERAEVFGSHTWRPSDRWSVESRLAWETSTLTFSGDSVDETELSFWKPSVQLTRTFGENNQARLRVYRDVGQLDFGDFVSAAAIADSLIAGGNTGLQPASSWRVELGTDFRFTGGAALSLTLAYHDITDAQDLVLLTAPNPDEDPLDPDDDLILFDAPGNIGDAEQWRLDVNYSTPVSFIPGGRLTLSGYLRQSEVTDPVTDEPRDLSNTPESLIEVNFRQDLSDLRLAWGLSAVKQGETAAYRFNEIDGGSEEGPWVDAWIETTALPNNMRLRLTAANVADGDINRDRRFFTPDRSGAFLRSDVRQRAFPSSPWFILQLSGSF